MRATAAVKCFRVYLCMMVLATVNKGTFIYLQSLGRAFASTAISMVREVLFGVGFALLLPQWFGLDGVFLSSDCPDLYSPKVLRATMGGIFKIPLEVSDDLTEVIDRLQETGIRVCAAALDGQAVPLQQAGLGNGCAVVIGNEGNGLPGHLIERCGQAVMIPMRPDSESLNAAMAAGIFLWEMCGRSGYPRNA